MNGIVFTTGKLDYKVKRPEKLNGELRNKDQKLTGKSGEEGLERLTCSVTHFITVMKTFSDILYGEDWS